jgi:septation ring formation regulator EzrA
MQTDWELKDVQARCEQLEADLANSREAIQQLVEMRKLNRELETQMADTRVDFESKSKEATQQLEEYFGRNQALEKEVADLHEDIQSAVIDSKSDTFERARPRNRRPTKLHSARGS